MNIFDNRKKVCCLYRVSTAGQVEKDDIPLQKQRCREFAEEKGWVIVEEHFEKGVSDYKKSIFEREEMQKIYESAQNRKFDILLVFMFDRIGRRGIETTYFAKLLSETGIKLWSTVEGQQSFDSDMDEIISALRFTQAKAESKKTSVRTKTRLGQIVQEGRFRGGSCPFGYKLVKRGRMNRRNHEAFEIEIDEAEAEIVQLIFNKYVFEGYGTRRIAKYLLSRNILTREGRSFSNTTINHMLKNVLYTGVLRSGEMKSEIFKELQIISPEIFAKAAKVMEDRTMHRPETPLNTKGSALLSGLLFCADCGTKLVLTSSSGRNRERRMIYQCHHKVRHPDECENQGSFSVHILDPIVEKAVMMMLDNMKNVPADEIIKSRYESKTAQAQRCVDRLKKEIEKLNSGVSTYKAEVAKALCGESKWDDDLLREVLNEAQTKLAKKEAEYEIAAVSLADANARMAEIEAQHEEILSWAKIFRSCSNEAKKMILSKLIERIEVGRDYDLKISFRVSYAQFCGICEDDENGFDETNSIKVS